MTVVVSPWWTLRLFLCSGGHLHPSILVLITSNVQAYPVHWIHSKWNSCPSLVDVLVMTVTVRSEYERVGVSVLIDYEVGLPDADWAP